MCTPRIPYNCVVDVLQSIVGPLIDKWVMNFGFEGSASCLHRHFLEFEAHSILLDTSGILLNIPMFPAFHLPSCRKPTDQRSTRPGQVTHPLVGCNASPLNNPTTENI